MAQAEFEKQLAAGIRRRRWIEGGMLRTTVYVNGKEVGRTEPFSHCDVAEFHLTSRVKVTVSFSRTIWRMAHISFSDDTASVEV